MALPTFTMRQLLEAGVHYGHHTRRWNPKMAPYIFGARNKTHIIDLEQTVPMLYAALKAVRDTAAQGGRVLFVGTKLQASAKIKEAAKQCGQYYINHRWLGGLLTNWKTVNQSIKRLKAMEENLKNPEGMTKKEVLKQQRAYTKLEKAIGGISDMGGLPNILFVIDINKESIAVQEAKCLGIPVIGITDTNTDPAPIDYIIPGNDDATRSIHLYCDLIAESVLDGLQAELRAKGVDIGSMADLPVEQLKEAADAAEKKARTEKKAKASASEKKSPKKASTARPKKNPQVETKKSASNTLDVKSAEAAPVKSPKVESSVEQKKDA